MIGNCPRCELRLDLPQSGSYRCQRCGQTFEVVLADPAFVRERPRWLGPPQAPAPIPAAPGFASAAPQGHCAAHPSNPATDACERCGDFMCQVCRTTVEGRCYCPRCFDLLFARGALQFTQVAFKLPAYSLALGIISAVSGLLAWTVCAGFVSLPAGIIGVLLGISALREIGRRPDLPGHRQAVSGIVCGAIGVLISIAGWVILAVIASRGGS